jgi:hypothetical protein
MRTQHRRGRNLHFCIVPIYQSRHKALLLWINTGRRRAPVRSTHDRNICTTPTGAYSFALCQHEPLRRSRIGVVVTADHYRLFQGERRIERQVFSSPATYHHRDSMMLVVVGVDGLYTRSTVWFRDFIQAVKQWQDFMGFDQSVCQFVGNLIGCLYFANPQGIRVFPPRMRGSR